MREVALQVQSLKKQYRLGAIGGRTLQADVQSWWAKKRGRGNPNLRIDQDETRIGEKFYALDGIDMTVYKGETLGIIGNNGSGKTTLLKLISQITAPTEGDIDIYGRVTSMLEIGTGFHGEMTGRENIYMNGAILGMSRAEIDEKIEDIIEFSECRQFIDTPVKRYSSGMYVKLAFSVAANLESEIMIMDEILAVGDMTFQKKCIDKMSELAQKEGKTILYVSHNMSTIRQLCERCMVLNHGKVIYMGDVETAIGYYLDYAGQSFTEIDYSNQPVASWIKDNAASILNVSYIGKESCVFRKNETATIRMKYRFNRDVSRLGIRIVLRTPDRISIGAGFIYDFSSGRKGEEKETEIQIELTSLAPGNYEVYYVLFEADRDGAFTTYENRRGLDIVMENDDSEIMPWRTSSWGHMVLPIRKCSK